MKSKILFFLLATFPVFLLAQPLTLKESISIALKNNPSLKVAKEKVKEAEAEKEKSISYFLPHLYSSSSYTRLDEKKKMEMSLPPIPGFPPLPETSITLTDEEIYDYNLTITQPIFTGGRLTALYRMNNFNFKCSLFQQEKVKNDLIFEVKKAYYEVLTAEKLKKVGEETLKQTKAHLKVVENFYREGMVPEVEVTRARVAVSKARELLINTENSLKLARAYFNSVLHRDMDEEVLLEDILECEEAEVELEKCIREAFLHRPELKELEERIKMGEEGIKIARSDFFPQVSLLYSWDRKRGEEIPIDEWQESWMAVVSVTLNIWDWGATRNEVRKAKAQVEQLKQTLQLLKKRVELEVRQAYLNLISSKERIKVSEERVKEAEKNFHDTSLRFQQGMATNTDVLDAQTMLTRAKSDYYHALYNYKIALARLEKAMGREISDLKREEK
ncbi:MAG TPA: TolC family protein [bacterium]|nr:TolC family protein [bacterium]HEX68157.1 TolC family protein [bacterium]